MLRLTLILTAALIIAAAAMATAGTYQQFPTDDIWAYDNASDPTGDPQLRAWGHLGYSIAPNEFPFWDTNPDWNGEIGYSFAKWSASSIPAGAYNVTAASVTVKARYPDYTQALGQQNPLEAHAIEPYFSEATWSYTQHASANGSNRNPGVLFGTGDLSAYSTTQIFAIPINLLANESALGRKTFNAHFNRAVNSSPSSLALAFASTIDVGTQNGGSGGHIYKFYSKDAGDGTYGPNLAITFQPIPASTTASAKAVALGTRVYLQNVAVIAVSPNDPTPSLTVSDGSGSIRIKSDEYLGGITVGQVVSVIGVTALWGTERGIEGENVLPVPQIPDSYPTSVAAAKSTAIPTVLSTIHLSNVIVTAVFPDAPTDPNSPNEKAYTVYVEQPNRSSGIGVKVPSGSTSGISVGAVVNVAGYGVVWDGAEFQIDGVFSPGSGGGSVSPVALTNKAAGGGSFARQPGIAGATGLSSVGLLIKTTGTVTGSRTSFPQLNAIDDPDPDPTTLGPNAFVWDGGAYWIDDGSGLVDGLTTDSLVPSKGLAVLLRNGETPPTGHVAVTGILRAIKGPNGPARILVPLQVSSY